MALKDDAQRFVNDLQLTAAGGNVSELIAQTAARILSARGHDLSESEHDTLAAMEPLELSNAVLRLAREPLYMLEDELGKPARVLN